MGYSWTNDDLWQIRITQNDFAEFEQPYIGNGVMGVRFDRLVAGTDRNPLYTLSRCVYDGGKQLLLPAWNHIFLEAGGVGYTPENGKHRLEQVLDLRNAVVTMSDRWEYKNGKMLVITVEMFIPRTFGHASYLSFSIDNLDEAACLRFGILDNTPADHFHMAFSRADEFTVLGDYRTAEQGRPVSQALRWKGEGLGSISVNDSGNGIEASAGLGKGHIKLELFHALISYEESGDTGGDVIKAVDRLCGLGRDALLGASSAEWKKLWKNGIAFKSSDFNTEKSLLAHQFYLLCSLEKRDDPLGPLGLSKNEWCGSQLWDADFWVFRAILPLWKDFARPIIGFRRKTLGAAREHAQVTGYSGAWYPWMADEKGRNITRAGYNDELHINLWIALAAWEYFAAYGDREYLSDTGWPVISSIADFFASRAELGNDGHYHINCVLGPDESVYECGQFRVNDNFLTNFGVKRLMEAACEAAGILGLETDEQWKAVGDRIFLLPPNENGIIPEYKGYNGHGIKQADVILAFYPLGCNADPEIIHKNIKFYRDKQMYYGPLMSSQIESCILMRLGEKERGLKRLFEGMREFSRGKHYIPFECRDNDNSIMLTGIAGELQALIYGYYEADLNSFDKIPRIAQSMDGLDAEKYL